MSTLTATNPFIVRPFTTTAGVVNGADIISINEVETESEPTEMAYKVVYRDRSTGTETEGWVDSSTYDHLKRSILNYNADADD